MAEIEIPFGEWVKKGRVKRGFVVARVTAPGCGGGNGFELRMVHCLTDNVDKKGVSVDAVWQLRRDGVAVQLVRLWRGCVSVQALLEWGTVLDGKACTFTAKPRKAAVDNLRALSHVRGETRNASGDEPRAPVVFLIPGDPVYAQLIQRDMQAVPKCINTAICGIPQPTPRSGVCWWGALSFVLSTSPQLLQVMTTCLPPDLAQQLPRVAQDPRVSEEVRAQLFYRYDVGNDPGQDPGLDGANGYNELIKLCARLELPFCVRVWNGKGVEMPVNGKPAGCVPKEAVLLGVRAPRNQSARPPLRLTYGGHHWHLRGILQGSRHCGHQTSVVRLDGNFWAIHDTDWCTHGVAPLYHLGPAGDCDAGRLFWASLTHLVLISNQKQGGRLCHVNGANGDLETLMRSAAVQNGASVADGEMSAGKPQRDVEVECLYTRDTPDTRDTREG